MLTPSAARPLFAAAFVAVATSATHLVLALPTAPPATVQGGFQAPGAPIYATCDSMQATVDKLKAGLPLQNEWIRRSEEQLRAAEEGVRGSQDQLKDMALKAAVDLVASQLEMVRAMKAGIAKSAASNATRLKWLERVDRLKEAAEKIEQAEKLGKAGVEGNQLGAAIAQNRAQLADFLKFLDDSGIGDAAALQLAEFAGPVGVAVVETLTVARDVLYATFQGKMSADEASAHRTNLEGMKSAKAGVETRIYELNTDIAAGRCQPTPKPEDRSSVKKEPDQPPLVGENGKPAKEPAAPKDGATPTQNKPSGAKLLGTLVVAGGAGVAGYYYLDKGLKKIEGGGVTAKFVSASTINCPFNAGGIVSNCSGTVTIEFSGSVKSGTAYRFMFDAGPGGNRTISGPGQYGFSISSGTSTSTCPTLRTGTVTDISTQLIIASFSNMPITVSCK
jgi:hypothetical protein